MSDVLKLPRRRTLTEEQLDQLTPVGDPHRHDNLHEMSDAEFAAWLEAKLQELGLDHDAL